MEGQNSIAKGSVLGSYNSKCSADWTENSVNAGIWGILVNWTVELNFPKIVVCVNLNNCIQEPGFSHECDQD